MSKIHLPPDGKLRALSVREPFASLIVMGFKPIENRTIGWPSTLPLPCTIAIQASTDDYSIAEDLHDVTADPLVDQAFASPHYDTHKPGREYFYGGTIIGLVDVVACVDISQWCDGSDESEAALIEAIDRYEWKPGVQHPEKKRSDWANGPRCLIFDNPRRLKTGVVCPGQLNFWRVPDAKRAMIDDSKLLYNPQDLPCAPVGGVAKWLGKKAKKKAGV